LTGRTRFFPPLTKSAYDHSLSRYVLKDGAGVPVESYQEMFRRVCDYALKREGSGAGGEVVADFRNLITGLVFLPGTPVLVGAGVEGAQLFAAVAFPFRPFALTRSLLVTSQRGGAGTSYCIRSRHGEQWDRIRYRISQLDKATRSVKQGGCRQGCSLAVMRADDPNVDQFVMAKLDRNLAPNTGTSVALNDSQMEELAGGGDENLFSRMTEAIHEVGEPGVIFSDEVNRENPISHLGHIGASSACAEVPLMDYEACQLGAVDVSKLIYDGDFDFDLLKRATKSAVRFLDDMIDLTSYPDERVRCATMSSRKMGVGVMGLADLFASLELQYGEDDSVQLCREIASTMRLAAMEESKTLAEERGSCPALEEIGVMRRNATLLAIPPSGSISLIAGCSSGIEPYFSFPVTMHRVEGTGRLEVSRVLVERLKRLGFRVSAEGLLDVPTSSRLGLELRSAHHIFRTATELAPERHLAIAKAFQTYFDNSVSKTVALQEESSPEEVSKIIVQAWRMGLKGISIFRPASGERLIYS